MALRHLPRKQRGRDRESNPYTLPDNVARAPSPNPRELKRHKAPLRPEPVSASPPLAPLHDVDEHGHYTGW